MGVAESLEMIGRPTYSCQGDCAQNCLKEHEKRRCTCCSIIWANSIDRRPFFAGALFDACVTARLCSKTWLAGWADDEESISCTFPSGSAGTKAAFCSGGKSYTVHNPGKNAMNAVRSVHESNAKPIAHKSLLVASRQTLVSLKNTNQIIMLSTQRKKECTLTTKNAWGN